jgi:thiol-disulfide isomerase/thioredoxin
MKNILIKIVVGFVLVSNAVTAQTNEVLIGRQMPEVKLNNLVNSKNANLKLSDFRGKLVILDFWATYCAPCISMFSRTESLQKAFEGKVQFLSVTKEPLRKVQPFLDRMYKTKGIKPISVVGDTLLSKYFYYASIPYYVWINASGKVIATTDAEEITVENINSVLTGKQPRFANRRDIRRKPIDNIKSLFVVNDNFILKDPNQKREEVKASDILGYSIATRWIDDAHGGSAFDSVHFNCYNVSIDYAYRKCFDTYYYSWPQFGTFDSQTSHVFEMSDSLLNSVTVPDSSPINGNSAKTLEWGKKHGISYETFFPVGITWENRFKTVKNDLDNYFGKKMGFTVEVEKRVDSNTTVLKVINNGNHLLISTGEKAIRNYDRYSYMQKNASLNTFVSLMNSYFLQGANTTIVDKTGLKGNVDIDLNCDLTRIDEINIGLDKYGLKLVKEPTLIDVLVFKEIVKVNVK